jgi:hypothetical protein
LPSSPNFRLSNFLSDKATQPYMAMIDLCAAFGVGQSTAGGKARVVSAALHTHRMAVAEHCRPGVDGGGRRPSSRLAREPREVQETALAKGLIPLYNGGSRVGWEVAPGIADAIPKAVWLYGSPQPTRGLAAAVTPADEGK